MIRRPLCQLLEQARMAIMQVAGRGEPVRFSLALLILERGIGRDQIAGLTAQDLADVVQHGGADTVGAPFIFLYLLKRNAQRGRHCFLREAHLATPPANISAYGDIDPVRRFALGVAHVPTGIKSTIRFKLSL